MARVINYYRSYYTNIADGGHLLNPGEAEDTFLCEPEDWEIEDDGARTPVEIALDVLNTSIYAISARLSSSKES